MFDPDYPGHLLLFDLTSMQVYYPSVLLTVESGSQGLVVGAPTEATRKRLARA